MPAVPLSLESNSRASTLTDDQDREFTTLYEESGFTDVSGLAFTVLQEDKLKHSSGESESSDHHFETEDEEVIKSVSKRRNYRKFDSSLADQKILNRSNAYLLQQKLMVLSKSNSNLQTSKKSRNIGTGINNLNGNKSLSKSNGHLPYQEKDQLKKDISKSFNNLQRHNINRSENNIEKEHKNYHRYCHLSGSTFRLYNNMTAVKQKSTYDRDFSTITDAKIHKFDTGMGRRKTPPGTESYINGNNNNITKSDKNNRFYASNFTKNGYTNNNKLNEKNQMINEENKKPIFITTVKTGKFLDPPPELAILLGLNNNLNDSMASSTNGSSNSLNGSIRDRHQQQVLLYSFSSQPRVLHQHHHRAKCDAAAKVADSISHRNRREATNNNTVQNKTDDGPVPYGNIMYDRRVIRGSTYAQHPMPQTDGESQAARQQEARRRAVARRRAQGQQTRNARFRLRTPPPVAGRKHENIQTERYLEEISDRPPETDASCQTDLFLERAETPVFVPAKVGLDVETQIYPGDLFDFDLEVQPILEVLVGKTVEQALIEVLEEEELEALRAQQRRFLELRAGEKAEQQRLEEQERRLREEKDNRLKEYREASAQQKEAEERIAAAVLSHGYLADLLPSVLEGLKEAGYLLDDIRVGVEEGFMPWLMTEVKQEMNHMVASRDVLTEIVREILETRAEIYRVMGEEEAKELDLESEEEEQVKPEEVVEQTTETVVEAVVEEEEEQARMILTIPGLTTRPPVEMLPSSPNSLSISTDNSKMNLDRNSSVDVRKTCSKSTIKATALTDIPRGTMSEDISVADMDELINTNHNVAVRVTKQGKMKASGCEDKRILEAKFADDCHSYNVLIQRGSADNMLILQTVIHIKAGDELLLWFSEEVAAALAIPFLTPLNIQGEKKYVCHLCDKQYEIPNPLKIHLALDCGRFNRRHLWDRLANNSSAQKESENGNRIQCHILPMLSSLPPPSPLLGFKFELTPTGESDKKSEATEPQDLSATSSHTCAASSSFIDQIVTSQNNGNSKAIITSGSLSVRESAFRPYLNKQPSFSNAKMVETEIKLRKPPVLDMLPNLQPSLLPHPHCIFHPPPQVNATMVKTTTAPEFLRRNTVTPSRLYLKETVRTSAFPFTQQCAEPTRTDFHHAAEMETLVSNLGRSKQGHLCIYCGKIYSRKYGLKIHIRTHTGYKPLKCKYCLRPFGDPSNLNKHVRLHAEGDTPYRCELCGKILVRRRDLERHLKSRHSPHPETEQDPEANKIRYSAKTQKKK